MAVAKKAEVISIKAPEFEVVNVKIVGDTADDVLREGA